MSDISVDQFWNKLGIASGCKTLITKALVCFFVLTDGDTPAWVKALLVGALTYFINPLDPLGPDPLVWLDDIAVLTSAIASAQTHIKHHHKKQAEETANQL